MNQNNGILYLIPSPIGNLSDMSKRSIEVLNMVDLIYCEDTRNTQKLLNLLNIKKKTISCHEHNEKEMSFKLISLLKEGHNIAYMSDAGYPAISDPGEILVNEVIKSNLKAVPLSGPTASLTALIASSLPTSHFLFYGFLSSKRNDRKKEINELKNFPYTIIFYEAPHRINETLIDLYEILGNRKITIAREISKIHEEFIYTNLKEISSLNKEFKGELVLILEGKEMKNNEENNIEEALEKYNELIKNGVNKKDALLCISLIYNINKNLIKKMIFKEE